MMKVRLFLFLAVIFLFSAGCGEKIKPGTAPVERLHVSGIKTEVIGPSQVDKYYETSGTVKAAIVSDVASRVMGTVTSVRVKEGDRVAKGQLLLTIDDSDTTQRLRGAREGYLEAGKALDAAEENRGLARATYERYRRLYEEKALTGQEFDQIKTRTKIAEIEYERVQAAMGRAAAAMEEAKVFQGFTRVSSPVSGVVTQKKVDPGSMAVPGTPLMTVEDNSSCHLEIGVAENLAYRIRPGTVADVFLEALQREVRGNITEVVPSVDPSSRSFLVKVALKSGDLRNGLYARVSIPVGKKETLLVPTGSIIERGQLTGLYTVGGDSVITYRLVRTGRIYGEKVEILSGLKPGERVIVEGAGRAADGGIAAEAANNGRRPR